MRFNPLLGCDLDLVVVAPVAAEAVVTRYRLVLSVIPCSIVPVVLDAVSSPSSVAAVVSTLMVRYCRLSAEDVY